MLDMTPEEINAARVAVLKAGQYVAHSEERLANDRERLINAMRHAREAGMTLQTIGDVAGLSRQRVKQLLDR